MLSVMVSLNDTSVIGYASSTYKGPGNIKSAGLMFGKPSGSVI